MNAREIYYSNILTKIHTVSIYLTVFLLCLIFVCLLVCVDVSTSSASIFKAYPSLFLVIAASGIPSPHLKCFDFVAVVLLFKYSSNAWGRVGLVLGERNERSFTVIIGHLLLQSLLHRTFPSQA